MVISNLTFYFFFTIGFAALYPLVRPKRGCADRELRHTPLQFSTMLIMTLFLIFEEGRSPMKDMTADRLLGIGMDVVITFYLIRLYLRLYRRLEKSSSQ